MKWIENSRKSNKTTKRVKVIFHFLRLKGGCSLVFAFKSKLELEASALGIKSVVYLRSPGEYRDPSASHFQESASLRKEFQIMKEAKMHLTENPKAPEDKKC